MIGVMKIIIMIAIVSEQDYHNNLSIHFGSIRHVTNLSASLCHRYMDLWRQARSVWGIET